eukprot:CAMPEP_0184500356 /NCGR_PEP_ID=MMETSP0113_2-20130426/44482_1 /TAXON_ID=91329 /ORGANISM="Norrisiella sphaerica, Strain BC52" /LENGTH=402 /DNA_ID=CAMNT_0026888681 /DNA_START=161 /DNA_END=1369 /DNA_ORIENTATION=+
MTFIDPQAGAGLHRVVRQQSAYPQIRYGADKLWENEKNRFTRLKREEFFRDYIKILKHHNIGSDGYLYQKLQFLPSNGELCRHYMRPHDRLILAEEDPQLYRALEAYYAHDSRVTTLNMGPKEVMRSQLPPRNPNGVVVYDCHFEQEAVDFIRYLNRFPQATVMITYNGSSEFDKIYPGFEPRENDDEMTPRMRNSDRLQTSKIYKRIIQRGFRFVLGCEFRYKADDNFPKMGGTLVANPPWAFDQQLESELDAAERGLEDLFEPLQHYENDKVNYFWATKTPHWYRKILGNHKKLPYNYHITGSAEVRKIRSAKTTRNMREKVKEKRKTKEMERKMAMWKITEKGRLRRRYVEDFKEDSDPADYIDAFMPRVRHSLKWNPNPPLKKTGRTQNFADIARGRK